MHRDTRLAHNLIGGISGTERLFIEANIILTGIYGFANEDSHFKHIQRKMGPSGYS